jgi:hypothetical protein
MKTCSVEMGFIEMLATLHFGDAAIARLAVIFDPGRG